MKKIASALLLSAFALPVSMALAAPVFHQAPTASINEQTNVVCVDADISGLGNQDVLTTVSVVFGATTVCRNRGGNTAPGQGIVTVEETFPTVRTEVKNGRAVIHACTDPIDEVGEFPTPSAREAGCPNGNWTVDPIDPANVTIEEVSAVIRQQNRTIFSGVLFP